MAEQTGLAGHGQAKQTDRMVKAALVLMAVGIALVIVAIVAVGGPCRPGGHGSTATLRAFDTEPCR